MLGLLTANVFLGASQLHLARRGILTYVYHKIAIPPEATIDPFLYTTPQEFKRQLGALRSAGFASTSLSETVAAQNRQALKVIITFDDGCSSAFRNSLEPLARHRFCAIQFLVADFLGRTNEWDMVRGDAAERLMDEHQVREWLAAGHEIGSHTVTHRNLRHLSAANLREEIFASKKSLEDRFGIPIPHFCYPYGSWNERVRDLVREAGYQTACTMRLGVNTPTTPRFHLRRIIPLSSLDLLRKCRHRLAWRIRPNR